MARRICCVLLMLCVLLLSGCDEVPDLTDDLIIGEDGDTVDTPEEAMVFSLPYSHDDTLNPFSAATEVNLQLARLLYDSLTVITDGYVPVVSLAADVLVTDATHLTVPLREGAVFSDGSAVTADDVVKSFQRAKSSPNYQALLSNVISAKGNNKKREITFTLATPDIHADGCLTFPIVKVSTLTDKAAQAPIGGGLYRLEKADGAPQLVKNPHHPTAVEFDTVALRHLPGTAARYYALASGQLAYYFDDLSEGETPRITGASQPVELNAMIFLGINSDHDQLGLPAVRQALSLLLDRAAAAAVYGDRGMVSASPLPTAWLPMAEVTTPPAAQDTATALELLKQADYPLEGKKLPELRLIYNKSRSDRTSVASFIRTQAEACGIKITLMPLSETEYRTALAEGEYELYLGEYRFGTDMSLRSLLLGGETSYGVAEKGASSAAYTAYLGGTKTLQSFIDVFGTDMPFIPLCYRGGVAAYDRRLTAVTPTGYDPYHGIAVWQ